MTSINLKVKKGELVALVGTVGCGKSSLVSALLGQMVKMNGRVNVLVSVSVLAHVLVLYTDLYCIRTVQYLINNDINETNWLCMNLFYSIEQENRVRGAVCVDSERLS